MKGNVIKFPNKNAVRISAFGKSRIYSFDQIESMICGEAPLPPSEILRAILGEWFIGILEVEE